MRAENNGITWLDGNLLVDACCHTGKCCHGLTLASGCDQYQLLIRVILHLVDLDQGLIRDIRRYPSSAAVVMTLTMLRPSTATLRPKRYAVLMICCTRSTLDAKVAMIIRAVLYSLKRLSNTCPTVRSDMVKPGRSALVESHITARTPLRADLCKTLQVNGITEYRCIIYLEVSCMHHNSNRGINSQCRCILDTVVGLNKLDGKITKVDRPDRV